MAPQNEKKGSRKRVSSFPFPAGHTPGNMLDAILRRSIGDSNPESFVSFKVNAGKKPLTPSHSFVGIQTKKGASRWENPAPRRLGHEQPR